MNRRKSSLSPNQVKAIKLSKRTGKLIINEYPGIADEYRAGMTQGDIARDYGISREYGVTDSVATKAVEYALHRLIPEDEMGRLRSLHLSDAGRVGSSINKRNNTAIFSLSSKQLSEAGKKGGRKGGRKLYEEGRGIHAQTPEERLEAGRKAALAKGYTPWSEEEKHYLLELCGDPGYRHMSSRYKRYPDYKRITVALESKFGTRRSVRSLHKMKNKCLKKGLKLIPKAEITYWGPFAATPGQMAEEWLYICNGEMPIPKRRTA